MNNNIKRCPPAGVYDVRIVSWLDTGTHHAVVLRLTCGPFAGYTFRDAFKYMTIKQTERELGRGAWNLISRKTEVATARLVRRFVNGVQNLGVKSWGWR
jgi:hypothetical protein